MLISDLILNKNIIAHLEAKDRSHAYQKILEHAVAQCLLPKEMVTQAQKALQTREDKMTTAMGGGFAIPHATVAKLPAQVTLFARCPTGIDCAAMDGKPVKLFFLILMPGDKAQAHLQTLATVAKFFNRRGVKTKILEAKSSEDILAIFRAA